MCVCVFVFRRRDHLHLRPPWAGEARSLQTDWRGDDWRRHADPLLRSRHGYGHKPTQSYHVRGFRFLTPNLPPPLRWGVHHRPARSDSADSGRGGAFAARRSVCVSSDSEGATHRLRRRYTHTLTHSKFTQYHSVQVSVVVMDRE